MLVVPCGGARARDEGTAPGWGRALRGDGPGIWARSGPEERVRREARAGARAHRCNNGRIDRVVGAEVQRGRQDGIAWMRKPKRVRVPRSETEKTPKRFEI